MAGIAPSPLTLSSAHIDEIISHAAKCSPAECCGLIAGRQNLGEKIIRISNTSPNPNNFIMDPKELVNAFHRVDQMGMQVIAMYHSHPVSEAIPSETDISQCNYPDIPQLIIGKNQDDWIVRSFLISETGFREIEIKLAS